MCVLECVLECNLVNQPLGLLLAHELVHLLKCLLECLLKRCQRHNRWCLLKDTLKRLLECFQSKDRIRLLNVDRKHLLKSVLERWVKHWPTWPFAWGRRRLTNLSLVRLLERFHAWAFNFIGWKKWKVIWLLRAPWGLELAVVVVVVVDNDSSWRRLLRLAKWLFVGVRGRGAHG